MFSQLGPGLSLTSVLHYIQQRIEGINELKYYFKVNLYDHAQDLSCSRQDIKR